METYDVVVLGGGSGSQVATAAAERGLEAAVVEPGPLGGACITRGCVPSKALIHRAELLEEIHRADRFGIDAAVRDVRYGEITDAVRETVFRKAANQRRALERAEHVTLYEAGGRFVDERTVELVDELDPVAGSADSPRGTGGARIRGEHVVVAVGSRPVAPPIDGLSDVASLTSDDALFLDERPDRLVIVGGGYVGAELGYAFGAFGTEVSIVGRSDRLVPREDRAVSAAVERSLERYCELYPGHEVTAVRGRDGAVTVTASPVDDASGNGDSAGDVESNGDSVDLEADRLLVAAGRKPNTDTLDLDATGLESNDDGTLPVDERLETDVEHTWALGDVVGDLPFKHVADYETEIVSANVVDGADRTVDYEGIPHAIFTAPQVASVGETEEQLAADGRAYEAVTVPYGAAPMGLILDPDEGFVKVLAEEGTILGCHVAGPQASTLIHEVARVCQHGNGTVEEVASLIRVHPALNEVLETAFEELAANPYATEPDWRDAMAAERDEAGRSE